jgi:type I restriction enzyme S subunit
MAGNNIQQLPLAALGTFRNGVNFGKGLKGSGLGLINVKDIFTDSPHLDFDSLDLVDLASVKGIDRYFVEEGDLFFVRSSVKRDGIGYVTNSNRSNRNSVHCGFVIRFRPNSEQADYRFLTYALRSPECRERIRNLSGGAAITNISQEALSTLLVDLPPLPIQRRIADILLAYDELIENSQRRIKILEQMARSLYREWFVLFRYPGHESVPLVPSPVGEIPQGWEVKAVADALVISGGGTPSRKEADFWDGGTIQWYSPSDLTGAGTMFMDDSSDHITERGLAQSSARMFPAHSVMLTSRATIGAIAINTQPACTNQGFITCLPNDRVPLYFLFHWLTENVPTFQRMASGATFKEISRGVFKTIEFLQPPSQIVERFEAIAVPMAKQVLALQRQILNLRRTRDLLLPRLLSGQIDVECD